MAVTQDHRAQICYRDTEVQIGSTGASTTVSAQGGLRYNGTSFQLLDGVGQYDPRTVWIAPHELLNDLVHMMHNAGPVLNNAYKLTTYAAGTPFVLSEVWYTSSNQTYPIVSHTFTYPSGSYLNPITEAWSIYLAGTSTIAHTVTDTISYAGILETSRTRSYT